jgi:hypothetical protein
VCHYWSEDDLPKHIHAITMKRTTKIFAIVFLLLFAISSPAQTPNYDWAQQGGNTSFNEGNIQVCNTTSGILAGGDFKETAQFGEYEIVSNGLTDIFIARIDAESGEPLQIESFGGENEEMFKFLNTDSEENIIVSFVFTDFISINGVDYTSFGGQDVLLLKYNHDLVLQWVKHYGTGFTDYIRGMDVDDEDNIMVYGKFKNQIDFDDITLTSNGSADMYIAKYDPEGDVIFAFSEGGSSYEDANAMDVGGNGDFFISGTFYGETIISGQLIQTENPTGILLIKYNSEGEFQWVEVVDGTKLLPNTCVAAGNNGNVYLTGGFQDEVTFGNETLSTGEFDQDIYIAKYTAGGEPLWAVPGHSGASDVVTNISIDIGGNICLAGFYTSSIHFGSIVINYSLC